MSPVKRDEPVRRGEPATEGRRDDPSVRRGEPAIEGRRDDPFEKPPMVRDEPPPDPLSDAGVFLEPAVLLSPEVPVALVHPESAVRLPPLNADRFSAHDARRAARPATCAVASARRSTWLLRPRSRGCSRWRLWIW